MALDEQAGGLRCLWDEHDIVAQVAQALDQLGRGALAGDLVEVALAEFERELIVERTKAGLASARARGRSVGRPFKMTAAKLRLAQAAMSQPETKVGALCAELGITRQTLYRHVDPAGRLRPDGEKLLGSRGRTPGDVAAAPSAGG